MRVPSSCSLKVRSQMKDSSSTSTIYFHQVKLPISSRLKMLMELSTLLDLQSRVKVCSIPRITAGNSSLIELRRTCICLFASLQSVMHSETEQRSSQLSSTVLSLIGSMLGPKMLCFLSQASSWLMSRWPQMKSDKVLKHSCLTLSRLSRNSPKISWIKKEELSTLHQSLSWN